MPTTTVSLSVRGRVYSDVQVWHAAPLPANAPSVWAVCAQIDHTRVPPALACLGPHAVYTASASTERYFAREVAGRRPETGLLAAAGDYHLVFFHKDGIRCVVLDLGVLHTAKGARPKADTAIFDRVLLRKRQLVPLPAPNTGLTADQIAQIISRTTLSGLRLRNLPLGPDALANERLAIREVYNMTKQAAAFAVRKYNYDFNKGTLTAAGVQDIVEKLLQALVDVDTV